MRITCVLLIIGSLIGTSCRQSSHPEGLMWDEQSRTFSWARGEVKIPPGFKHHGGGGLDTLEGHFSSLDGKLIIQYDIGWYAGAYANPKDAVSFEEHLIEGARVWTANRRQPDGNGGTTSRVTVTFPDAGCANFFVHSANAADAELIAQIAQSYRPGLRRSVSADSPCGGVPAGVAKK